MNALYHTWQRYRSRRTHRLHALPIAILMPHGGCNCRCVMCDIWKGNRDARQLSVDDIAGLLASFRRLGTQQVLLSGGEALLHPAFFQLCALLKSEGLYLTLLSTGLTLERHAPQLVTAVDEVIVSLDGDPATHDAVRNVPGAFDKLQAGVRALKALNARFQVSARCVIHKWNFRNWPLIVDTARDLGVDSVSFLPADVSSTAFNRKDPWGAERQHDVLIPEADLDELDAVLGRLLRTQHDALDEGFILESPQKLRAIVAYYRAAHGQGDFPQRRCNAPWVSAVVEADGAVRPCFFHAAIGNIHHEGFDAALNGAAARAFRKGLDTAVNDTCRRCVCALYLPPHKSPLPTAP
ncbi:radical SAM protein [Flaviaesturariibacter amylovorans]|uniref:Radical SAM core domain-containing protein n=1 Tax=Flaviaesturariibacter amylovorans TaxID=1084520 RepID=A0ABP8HEF9_9BACT